MIIAIAGFALTVYGTLSVPCACHLHWGFWIILIGIMVEKAARPRGGTHGRLLGGWILLCWLSFILFAALLTEMKVEAPGAKVDFTRIQMHNIEQALDHHWVRYGCFPTKEEGLQILVTRGIMEMIPTDMWGREFRYMPGDRHLSPRGELKGPSFYKLKSYGADGLPGGTGWDKDLVIGYRSSEEELNEHTEAWYNDYLTSMYEPEIGSPANGTVFRLLLLPDRMTPLCVVLEIRDEGSGILTAKKLSYGGGFDRKGPVFLGELVMNERYILAKVQVDKFLDKLDESDYWDMERYDRSHQGLGGAHWILEGWRDGEYHIVDRWSPDEGPYKEALNYLLNLSGQKTDAAYIERY